jgi:predicted transporter
MLSRFHMNPSYEAWVNSQETMLRRLINRNCTVIQYRYFLVFLLLASHKFGKAREECERILNIYPDNLMAKTVMSKLLIRAGNHVQRRYRRNQSNLRRGKCARCFLGRE